MLNPIISEIVTSQRRKVGTEQTNIETKLALDGDREISKVLSVNAMPYITGNEVLSGSVKFNGTITFVCVVLGSDGTIQNLTTTENFELNFTYNASEGSVIRQKCSLMDASALEIENNAIKLKACVEVAIIEITMEKNNYLSSIDGDAFSENSTIAVSKLFANINQTFNTVVDAEIKETPTRIISCSLSALNENCYTANNYVTATGILQYNICYEFQKEEGIDFKSVSGTSNYKYEIDCDGVNVKDMAYIIANVVPNTITSEIEIENKANVLRISADLNLAGEVYADKEITIVSDLFSCSNKLQITYGSVGFTNLIDLKSFEDKINGVIVVDENNPRVEKILCCEDNGVFLTKSIVENEKLTVEGIAYVSIVYLNGEDVIDGGMQFEIPFTTSLKLDEDMFETTPCVNCTLLNISARVRRGREIEVDADVKISSAFFKQKTDAVISDLNATEEKLVTENALSIYLAKDSDTVWSVSKKMKIDPEQLLSQNPSLQNGISKGDKIIVYRKK